MPPDDHIAGELLCPDGTKFIMFEDGSWQQEAQIPDDPDRGWIIVDNSDDPAGSGVIQDYDPAKAWQPAA